MDKIAVNAVAGSGKTTLIIDKLDNQKRVAIITYTTANQESIRNKIVKKYNYLPDNIYVYGYFEFIYSFCYLPLQNEKENRGICFEHPHYKNKSYYTKDGRIYSNRLSKLIMTKELPYLDRINRYFDHIFIDEMQDFGAFDFDWMLSLSKADTEVTLVGDFYQSTFLTSYSGNKNASIHSNYTVFKNKFEKFGFLFDDYSLRKSHRCSHNICEFISGNLNINMISNRDMDRDNTSIESISDSTRIKEILEDDDIKKLFYANHLSYRCNSDNWGASKGLTFGDVCVVLNDTTAELYKSGMLNKLKPRTLSKFYVACTRAKGNLMFIEQAKIPQEYKYN